MKTNFHELTFPLVTPLFQLVQVNGSYKKIPTQMPLRLKITTNEWHHYEFATHENITTLIILAGMKQYYIKHDKIIINVTLKKGYSIFFLVGNLMIIIKY